MVYKRTGYCPQAKQRAILERGLQHVHSIPYRATARWLFYRLLQEGFYRTKDDYGVFLGQTSRARHNWWGGWAPDTLSDDTRQSYEHDGGYRTAQEWADEMVKDGRRPALDHWYCQEVYVEAWFEADAMRAQFEYYTRGTTLRPLKGDPSIDYNWRIAKSLEESAEKYGLPIVVLYFGDCDKKGESIAKICVACIREWCSADFDFVRVGLNPGDGERLGIPENPDKPGTYQWEALTDEAARVMITGAVEQYVRTDVMDELGRKSREAGQRFHEYMGAFTL